MKWGLTDKELEEVLAEAQKHSEDTHPRIILLVGLAMLVALVVGAWFDTPTDSTHGVPEYISASSINR